MKWEEKRLDSICSLVTDGKHGDCQNQEDSGYYFISCKDVKNGVINYEKARQITQQDYLETHRRTQFEPYDIALTNSGTIGRIAVAKDDEKTYKTTFQKSVAILKPIKTSVNPFFLAYSLESNVRHLITQAGGTAQKNLLLKDLRRYKIPLPPLPTQRRIASILSAYDDLIENNLKRIKLLEEAAQHIYREWFVHFRFPGHEQVKMGADGLPEGWEISTFYKEVAIFSGGTPKTREKAFWDGEIPFFTPKDASSIDQLYIHATEKTLTQEGLDNCNSRLYPKNTVFITARGTVGKVRLAMVDMAMNQSCYALKMNNNQSQMFLVGALKEAAAHLRKTATGGVFDTIVVDTFKQIPFIVAPTTLVNEYHKVVTSLYSQLENLIKQTTLLKQARDILLPRLMNQTIQV